MKANFKMHDDYVEISVVVPVKEARIRGAKCKTARLYLMQN